MADDDKPKGTLAQLAPLLTAIAALIAALGAFFKPQDHSVTQSAYETLSTSIQKLSDGESKNHEDLVSLRGYLEGIAHGPIPVATSSMPSLPPPPPAGGTPKPVPTASPSAITIADAGSVMAMMSQYIDRDGVANDSEVPVLHAAPAPVKPPSFSDVTKAAAAKK